MSSPRLLMFVGLLLCALAPAAHALRCGTRLVTAGDLDFQVRERCGSPYWIEEHYQTIVAGDERIEVAQPIEYSAWYFNFGSNRLLVRLLFRDGRLMREDTLGRGVDELGAACNPARLSAGVSSGELVAYCGEPATRRVQPVLVSRRLGADLYRQTDIRREDWVYDFGGDFVYLLHLARGLVEAVEQLPR